MKPGIVGDIITLSILTIGVGILSALITKDEKLPDFIETKDGWLIKDTMQAKMAWAEHMLNKATEKEGEK